MDMILGIFFPLLLIPIWGMFVLNLSGLLFKQLFQFRQAGLISAIAYALSILGVVVQAILASRLEISEKQLIILIVLIFVVCHALVYMLRNQLRSVGFVRVVGSFFLACVVVIPPWLWSIALLGSFSGAFRA
jgi:hypothetical protein